MEEVKDSVFGRNLRAFRKARGLTQPDIAAIAEVSVTSENKWEKQGTQPRRHNVNLILEHFGLSEDDLLSEGNGFYAKVNGLVNAPSGATAVTPRGNSIVPVRVLGTTYAGTPDEPLEWCGDAVLYEDMAEKHPNCYALRVNGSCMDKVFTDQDYIYVDPDMELRDGSIAVMLIDGQSETRRVKLGNNSMTLVSESHEPQPDIIVSEGDGRDVSCQGIVFWWQAREELG